MRVSIDKNAFSLLDYCNSRDFERYLKVLKHDCDGKFLPAPHNCWVIEKRHIVKAKSKLKSKGFELVEVQSDIDYDELVREHYKRK